MKCSTCILLPVILGLCTVAAVLAGGEEYHLTVTGLVKQPIVYSAGDLSDFKVGDAPSSSRARSD